jgi:hypothetical protein
MSTTLRNQLLSRFNFFARRFYDADPERKSWFKQAPKAYAQKKISEIKPFVPDDKTEVLDEVQEWAIMGLEKAPLHLNGRPRGKTSEVGSADEDDGIEQLKFSFIDILDEITTVYVDADGRKVKEAIGNLQKDARHKRLEYLEQQHGYIGKHLDEWKKFLIATEDQANADPTLTTRQLLGLDQKKTG